MKNKVITDTFMWLFIGLLVCFGISYFTSTNEQIMLLVYGSFGGKAIYVYLALELILCFVLSLCITKFSAPIATLLYILYTALTGLSLSGIFLVYTSSSIAMVFLATAIIFGIFAIIGKTTNIDLSKWGIYLFIALLAIIVLEIINIFLMNNTLDIILCIVVILLFSAYTAYDMNRLVRTDYDFPNKGIFFAFQFFLDFINIFIKLLRLFGRRND